VHAQTILITGASKGIGLTIAEHLHAQGHTVYGTSRAATTREGSSQHVFKMLPLDVTNDESVRACVSRVLAESGKIDVLVNNAGYDLYGAAEETSLEETLAQLETNFVGTVRMTKAVLPGMRERKHGKIVQLSSIGGMLALPNNSAYAASKFALEGYSEALRYEMRPFNVFVSLVQPGNVKTETLDTSVQEIAQSHPAYAAKRARTVQKMRETGRTAGIPKEAVARVIQRIIETPTPHLRYPVGSQAIWVPKLKFFLPEAWFERFISSQFNV
jgi:short-subunit dehydrogenase